MRKSVQFPWTRFPAHVVETALTLFVDSVRSSVANPEAVSPRFETMAVRQGLVSWNFATIDEFYAGMRADHTSASLHVAIQTPEPTYSVLDYGEAREFVEVSVSHADRAAIERVLAPFEASASKYFDPPIQADEPQEAPPVVFIGHGGSRAWRDLKDHLSDKHGYRVEAYETGARAGHTIRDVLDAMLKTSTFAILVMTAEDEQADGTHRARQNVIHEAGLFQGRLGFSRAIVLLEEGASTFSNVDGIQYIGFRSIAETFGEVLATLRREFPGTP